MNGLIKEILVWYKRPYSGIEVDLDEKEVIIFTDCVDTDHTRPVEFGEFAFSVNFVKVQDDKDIHEHLEDILCHIYDTTRFVSVDDDMYIEDVVTGGRHIDYMKGGQTNV